MGGGCTWDEMQQTEKSTDQEGEKSHGVGNIKRGNKVP